MEEFSILLNLAEIAKEQENLQLKRNAKKLYDIKEIFKEAGFTEAQSFSLLQTLINKCEL